MPGLVRLVTAIIANYALSAAPAAGGAREALRGRLSGFRQLRQRADREGSARVTDNGSPPMIRLRGVAVHNLKHVDLDLPHRQWIAFCGVSGSGKTSLALDTLYAEGQRRYIESFSTYTRQFLEQLDKPAAESIEGIPPSVAVTRKNVEPVEPGDGRQRDAGERAPATVVRADRRGDLLPVRPAAWSATRRSRRPTS